MTKLILEAEPLADLQALLAAYNGDVAALDHAIRTARAAGASRHAILCTARAIPVTPARLRLIRALLEQTEP